MTGRIPGNVPRIGANHRPDQPQHIEVDHIEVFYTGPYERREKFTYKAPDQQPKPSDMRWFQFDPSLGLRVEKYDGTHNYVPIGATTKIVLHPAKVTDPATQVAELLNREGDSGEES